jgi:hypothetical protein
MRINKGTIAIATLLLLPLCAMAQGRGGRGGPPLTPKAGEPIDITGYWVSLVTEDWRYRMMTPAKGDFPSIPVNPAARAIAMAWDPAKEDPADACKSYGAGNVMRVAERLHITWDDDTTLKVETDNGEQTRVFHFGNAAEDHGQLAHSGPLTWQGDSVAAWELAGAGRGKTPAQRGGDLLVVTTHMKPGYLQKNGVPYSGDAIITEHFDLTKEPNDDQLLIVTTLIDDPTYLQRHFQRSTHFKKLPDATGWDPTPCSAK